MRNFLSILLVLFWSGHGLASPNNRKICFVSLLADPIENRAFAEAVLSMSGKLPEAKAGFDGLLHCFTPEENYTDIFILAHSTLIDNERAAIIYDLPPRLIPASGLLFLFQKAANSGKLLRLKIASCYPREIMTQYGLSSASVEEIDAEEISGKISLSAAAQAWIRFSEARN